LLSCRSGQPSPRAYPQACGPPFLRTFFGPWHAFFSKGCVGPVPPFFVNPCPVPPPFPPLPPDQPPPTLHPRRLQGSFHPVSPIDFFFPCSPGNPSHSVSLPCRGRVPPAWRVAFHDLSFPWMALFSFFFRQSLLSSSPFTTGVWVPSSVRYPSRVPRAEIFPNFTNIPAFLSV